MKPKIFNILTLFPESFSYLNQSILFNAQKKGLIKVNIYNLRDFSREKRNKVDAPPYGGGAGMVLMAGPIYNAVSFIKKKSKTEKKRLRVVLLSAKGKEFNQRKAKYFSSRYDEFILICGRYEGVDERIAKYVADEELSIGRYVLSGGELPAMVVVDAVSRLVPGVLKDESLKEESFSDNFLEYPQYTRPEEIEIEGKKRKVPKILLSGHHKNIDEWRKKKTKKLSN